MTDTVDETARATWQSMVQRAARGADPASILKRQFAGGVELKCLQTRDTRSPNLPGSGDLRRGFHPGHEAWLVGQFWPAETGLSAGQVASESESGVQAWQLPDGLRVAADLRDCLAAVSSSAAIDLCGDSRQARQVFTADPDTCVNANLDPFAQLLNSGQLAHDREIEQLLGETVDAMRGSLGHRVTACHGARYHASGASEVTELAVIFATFVEWLRRYDALGYSLEDASRLTVVRIATTVEVIPSIAKFRALRAGLRAVAHHCGDADAVRSVRIHALPATREFSRTAPWVNSLRSTAMAFAAAAGGADTIFTQTHDGSDSASSRRLARNTQLVLRDESGLAQVHDPAGGSGQIERHTDALLTRAWSQFQAIERDGGLARVLRAGSLQDTLRSECRALRRAAATRARALTGVSLHPDPIGASCAAAPNTGEDGLRCPAMQLSEDFDRLRSTGQKRRLVVHLHPMSQSGMTAARVTFCQNLLAAGGLATALDSPATSGLAILCGSDEDYAACDAARVASLRKQGYEHIYAAGAPQDTAERLQSIGVEGVVRVGDDVIAFLDRLYAQEV